MKKLTIWQNYDVDANDYRDWLEEEFPDIDDEWEQQRLVEDLNLDYLEDERANLNVSCGTEILRFGDLGLWDGRVRTFTDTNSSTISDVLYLHQDCEYGEFFIDEDGDLRSRQSHHDGTNFYLYRCWKPELSEEQRENFRDAIYERKCDDKMIAQFTNSIGPVVKAVYGWE